MRYVTVRVVDSAGKPRYYAKVSLFIYDFARQGMTEPQYTNSDGEANFAIDASEISVYVDGNERVTKNSVKAEYKVTV